MTHKYKYNIVVAFILALSLITTSLITSTYAAEHTAFEVLKRDSVTKLPIQGTMFTVYNKNGNIVSNLVTNAAGIATIPTLEAGWYKIVETNPTTGYMTDDIAQDFEIKKEYAASKFTVKLVFENKKITGLTIKKIDADTNAPIPNTHFRLYNNSTGNVVHTFVTNFNGTYNIPKIEAGTYSLEEVKPAPGYVINKEGRTTIKVEQNKDQVVVIKNTKASGLLIYKIDSITGEPVQGAVFLISDLHRKPIGEFVTDNNGRILLEGSKIESGKYYVKEIKVPDKYNIDSSEHTVVLQKGKLETLIVENTPKTGKVEILKRSGAENIYDGTAAGSPLANAYYGIFSLSTGKLVETIQTKANGWGISERIPIGTYILREIKAPLGYKLSDEEIKFEITKQDDVKKFELFNYPADIRLTGQKHGPQTAKPGGIVNYTITEIRNASTVPVDYFYIRDTIPTDILRLSNIHTGIYNIRKKYNVSVTTNKGREFIAYDNLMTTSDNYLDMSSSAINLQPNEFITSFKFNFGTVPTNFTMLQDIKAQFTVEKGLRHGLYFVNKADVGAKYNGEWTVNNFVSTSASGGTIIINPTKPKIPFLPNTGY